MNTHRSQFPVDVVTALFCGREILFKFPFDVVRQVLMTFDFPPSSLDDPQVFGYGVDLALCVVRGCALTIITFNLRFVLVFVLLSVMLADRCGSVLSGRLSWLFLRNCLFLRFFTWLLLLGLVLQSVFRNSTV